MKTYKWVLAINCFLNWLAWEPATLMYLPVKQWIQTNQFKIPKHLTVVSILRVKPNYIVREVSILRSNLTILSEEIYKVSINKNDK